MNLTARSWRWQWRGIRQRGGVGRTLMQAAESILVRHGARVLVVASGNHRNDAHAFYEKNGYAFTRRRYKKLQGSAPGRLGELVSIEVLLGHMTENSPRHTSESRGGAF